MTYVNLKKRTREHCTKQTLFFKRTVTISSISTRWRNSKSRVLHTTNLSSST
jgi:hypothetical protein